MKEDLFTNLPTESMIDILSTLPIPTILSCKCVCKSWRDLMESREFAHSHRAKSVPLLVFQKRYKQKSCEVIEFIDDQEDPCCNKSFSFSFDLPLSSLTESSVGGLLFLKLPFCICNPITREYIKLPHPPNYSQYLNIVGFGVSKISRQYKIFCVNINEYAARPKWDEGYIYTLVTGCWRSIIPTNDERLQAYTNMGMFLNGNLHWLAFDCTTTWIHSLDLETGLFSTLSTPSLEYCFECRSLTALGDRLCFLGYHYTTEEIEIWLMKEYGDEKSWTKEFVIKPPKSSLTSLRRLCLIHQELLLVISIRS